MKCEERCIVILEQNSWMYRSRNLCMSINPFVPELNAQCDVQEAGI